MEKKYTSLEHMIRKIVSEESPGTVARRKVVNVARPDDAPPTSEKSKLGKQGEIKTKIIDEEQVDEVILGPQDQPDVAKKDDKPKKLPNVWDWTPDMFKPKMPKVSMPKISTSKVNEDNIGKMSLHDPKELKGGTTEVDLHPKTNDNPEEPDSKEKKKSVAATKKANKEIGAKGAPDIKEENIDEQVPGVGGLRAQQVFPHSAHVGSSNAPSSAHALQAASDKRLQVKQKQAVKQSEYNKKQRIKEITRRKRAVSSMQEQAVAVPSQGYSFPAQEPNYYTPKTKARPSYTPPANSNMPAPPQASNINNPPTAGTSGTPKVSAGDVVKGALKTGASWLAKRAGIGSLAGPYGQAAQMALEPSAGAGEQELEWEKQNMARMRARDAEVKQGVADIVKGKTAEQPAAAKPQFKVKPDTSFTKALETKPGTAPDATPVVKTRPEISAPQAMPYRSDIKARPETVPQPQRAQTTVAVRPEVVPKAATAVAPAAASVSTPAAPVTRPPQPVTPTPRPIPAPSPSSDDLTFKQAFARARQRATEADPADKSKYTFKWRGKDYETNIKGTGTADKPQEPYVPLSKQKGYQPTTPIANPYENPDKFKRNRTTPTNESFGDQSMFKSDKNFGVPSDLLAAVKDVIEAKELSAKQKKIASVAGDPDKIDAADFKALRAGKKVEEEVENVDEALGTMKNIKAATKFSQSNIAAMDRAEKARKAAEAKKTQKEEVELSADELARLEEIISKAK